MCRAPRTHRSGRISSAETSSGSLRCECETINLWYLDALIECAAKVLARSRDGDIYFVGRSADSICDLLGGALAGSESRERIVHLPLSLQAPIADLSSAETGQLRANLDAAGLAPLGIARRRRPVTFCDLVHRGSTFTALYDALRTWIVDENAQWDVIRRKLVFVGIVYRTHASPKTWRWQQHRSWTSDLPGDAIVTISLDGAVWSYFGNTQYKLTESFHRGRWADEAVRAPGRDLRTRHALTEAVALVEAGRSRGVRNAIARTLASEPTFAEPWLRSIANRIKTGTA